MKHFYAKLLLSCGLSFLLLFPVGLSSAQFSGPLPSPTYAGDTVSFTNSITLGTTYAWTFESTPMDFSLTTMPVLDTVLGLGAGLASPVFVHTVNDDGQWYSFVSNYTGNFITRLSYGSSPLSVPTTDIIGSFGTDSKLEGVEVMKDTSGVWYGFTVNNTKLYRWKFVGNDLAGAITDTQTMVFSGALGWAHQLNIQWFPEIGKYIGFAINRNSSIGIVRLDFGNSLSNVPETTIIAAPSGTSDHCNFALIQEGKSWYMFITNLISNNLTRYDFGLDIENDSPAKVNLGNPGGLLNLPRGILMFPNCNENQLIGYLSNENGDFFKLNFDGVITDTPDILYLGNLGYGRNGLNTFTFEDHIYLMLQSTTGIIDRAPLFIFPNPHAVKYENATVQHVYADTGTYTATLYTNPGNLMGSSAGCKTFDVIHKGNNNTGIEDANHNNQYLKVYPNPFGNHLTIQLSIPEKVNSKVSLSIFDIFGRQVYIEDYINNSQELIKIDAEKWSAGVYHYILQIADETISTGKIVKSN